VAVSKYPAGANGAGMNIMKVTQQRLSRMAGCGVLDVCGPTFMAGAPRGAAVGAR
jgi:hypothetical protein